MAELKVTMIRNGTVIDHLPPGSSIRIADILRLETELPLIIAMNVESTSLRKKDLLKIEDRFLSSEETDRISLLAPNATINIVKEGKIAAKRKVSAPDELRNITVCPNNSCITNHEDCGTLFMKNAAKYKCHFCESSFAVNEFRV